MNFKYKITAYGEQYLGNDIEKIIDSIVKSSGKPRDEVSKIVKDKLVPFSRKEKGIEHKLTEQKNKKLGLKAIAAGARSAFRQITGINVNQEEINRRAIICSSCPRVSEVSGCMACGFAASLVSFKRKVFGLFKEQVSIPNGLESNYCDCCDCSLGMMLPARLEDFTDKTREDEERPTKCWLRK